MNSMVQQCFGAAIALSLLIVCARAPLSARGTPLDDYVGKPDPHYRWHDTGKRVTGAVPWEKWEGFVLNMTSQAWLSSADVDCPIWTHDIVIVKPCNYKHTKTALLVIGDGSNNGVGPSASDELLILAATVAVKTGTLAIVLYQVPNQPCSFASESPRRSRSEDELIAYTWSFYLDNPDNSDWALRLPMTKAVVRALDTVQAYAAETMKIQVDNFVVTGASKRGWTAWTTAAVDERVVGIIPVVMDALNMVPNLHHFYKSLGGWPVAFKPYYDANITGRLDSPEFKKLMDLVDPYVYRDRLSIPKLMITTSNDEFFLLDDSVFFWDELPGEKHTLILSNAEHSLTTGLYKLLTGIEAFFLSIVETYELDHVSENANLGKAALIQMPGSELLHEPRDCGMEEMRDSGVSEERRPGFGSRPKYWYNLHRDAGIIEIGTTEKPEKIVMWHAYTYEGTKGRDFRWFSLDTGKCPTVVVKNMCIKPVYFKSRTLKPTDLGDEDGMTNYYASLSTPKEGFGAFFVELRFAGPTPLTPFVFTTPAVIVPNYFPYGDCEGTNCRGTLV